VWRSLREEVQKRRAVEPKLQRQCR
jgi:hypothetical protein